MRTVDLFAGIGGFRAAAESVARATGSTFSCIATSEIDGDCQKVYQHLHSPGPDELNVGDVREIATSRGGSVHLPEFDLLLAGFPCQSFANIGHRGGFDDDRGQLFFALRDVIDTYHPPAFVLENVSKLTVLNKGAVMEEILRHLSALRYNVTHHVLNAADFGLPQNRRRLFIVGTRTDLDRQGRIATLDPRAFADPDQPRATSAWDVLSKEMPEEHLVPAGTRKTVLRKNENWAGSLAVNPTLARPLTASMSKWHRANQDSYFTADYVMAKRRRLALENLETDRVVGDLRRVTPLEALRLQGFPDAAHRAFDAAQLRNSSSYRLIGNAVPVPLAAAVTRMVVSCLP